MCVGSFVCELFVFHSGKTKLNISWKFVFMKNRKDNLTADFREESFAAIRFEVPSSVISGGCEQNALLESVYEA